LSLRSPPVEAYVEVIAVVAYSFWHLISAGVSVARLLPSRCCHVCGRLGCSRAHPLRKPRRWSYQAYGLLILRIGEWVIFSGCSIFADRVREFFFRPLVVELAAVDLVLAGLGEEVVDVRSMLKLWLDGGGGSPVLAVVNSGLTSSWNPARACAGRWRCRPCDDGNWRCVWKLGKFSYRSLGSCLFVSLSSRVLVVKGIVICFFI
jgi:hypothetical protein